jgi:hypothetical protein
MLLLRSGSLDPHPTPPHPTPISTHAPTPPSDFDMKLMDIDSEHLGIPDTEYPASVSSHPGALAIPCKAK